MGLALELFRDKLYHYNATINLFADIKARRCRIQLWYVCQSVNQYTLSRLAVLLECLPLPLC
jgi:hypothetical protein